MSTRLDTGARIAGISNGERVLEQIRLQVEQAARETGLDEAARSVAAYFDSYADQTAGLIENLRKSETRFGNGHYANIWSAPHERSDTVAVFIGGPHPSFDMAMSVDGVDEYQYWDSVDRPDVHSKDEWLRRKLYWREITPSGWLAQTMSQDTVPAYVTDLTDEEVAAEVLGRIRSRRLRAKDTAVTLSWTGDVSDTMSMLWPDAETEFPSLTPLIEAIEPLLVEITADMIHGAAQITSVTLERHPHLASLVDTVKVEVSSR